MHDIGIWSRHLRLCDFRARPAGVETADAAKMPSPPLPSHAVAAKRERSGLLDWQIFFNGGELPSPSMRGAKAGRQGRMYPARGRGWGGRGRMFLSKWEIKICRSTPTISSRKPLRMCASGRRAQGSCPHSLASANFFRWTRSSCSCRWAAGTPAPEDGDQILCIFLEERASRGDMRREGG